MNRFVAANSPVHAVGQALRTLLAFNVATLFPGCFSFVMATGTVAVAAHLDGLELIATWLLWLNVGAYLTLWILTLLRFACFRAQFLGDLTHHSRGAMFLTTTAGTCVLGCQFALLTPWKAVAEVCWLLGAALWVVLSYTFFVAITVCESKPPLEAGISGSWLLVIVATESISVLGSLVAPSMATTELVLLLSLAAYLVGAMLYVFFATLILYRWMFFRLEPEKFTPDYWIDMGALAISTLAGTLLFQTADRWNLLHRLEPVLAGSAFFFWATSTWWIPLLLIMEIWRHARRRVPWKYHPDFWSLVFPLGMYAVATFMLSKVIGLAFLKPIAAVFVYIALLAWGVTFGGMLKARTRSVAKTHPCESSNSRGG